LEGKGIGGPLDVDVDKDNVVEDSGKGRREEGVLQNSKIWQGPVRVSGVVQSKMAAFEW